MSKTQRWEWAIGLDLSQLDDNHLQQAYKLNWDNLCKFDNCRKNCKRILCLACFDKTWIDNESANVSNYDSFETSNCEQKRQDLKSFVGLKNLGATCYVNCLLQLWFHNPALRKAIYEWDNNQNQSDSSPIPVDNIQKEAYSHSESQKMIKSSTDNDSDHKQLSNTPTKRPHLGDDGTPTKKLLTSNSSLRVDQLLVAKMNRSSPVHDKGLMQSSSTSENYSNNNSSNNNSSNINNNDGTQLATNNSNQMNAIEQLQLIFARLQFTNKKSIDPFNFIESLALNAAEQQDAQEFGNLFIEFLEKSFTNQRNKFVSNIIKSQFLGRFSYATICDHCKHSSVSDSNFYELDLSIQNLETLHECLNEYFRPVPLDGKYNCSHCQKAQSAHRKIILKATPPTLNLQLLRFVYDKQRNVRQKLNSFIKFPEILDMTPYLNSIGNKRIRPNPFDLTGGINAFNGGPRDRSNIYILTAVLIHRGSSPHSGHYIAHIKDRVTKDWFKFNDDSVERIGPKLQVSTDGENITIVENESNYIKFNDPATGKVIKLESRSLKSKTAYMLVYQAHDNEALTYPSDHSEKWILPDHLQCAVAEENSKSDEMFESLQIAREVDLQVIEARRNQIRTIYDKLVCRDPSDRFEFIDRTWLQNWLTNASTTAKFSAIDNSHLLCIHNKLDFRKLDQVKCVRTEGADLLYKEFGGGPRLQDAMCRTCVEFEVKLIQMKERMKEDQKFITSQAKFKLDSNYDFSDAYIIGKNSYRDWQALVMIQFEKSHPELVKRNRDEPSSCSRNSSDEDENKIDKPNFETHNDNESRNSDNDDDAMEKFVFNSDILCEHNQLISDHNAWRIVPKEVWQIFKRYFDGNLDKPLIERNANTIMCADCKLQEVEQQTMGDIQKQIASQQKSKLPDLFHGRKRATWSTMLPNDEYFALNRQFLSKWQKFIRNPCNQEPPISINHYETLICKHDLTLYDYSNSNPILPESPFVLVSKQEIDILTDLYSVDRLIRFYVDPDSADVKLKQYIANHKLSGPKKSSNQENPVITDRPMAQDSGDHATSQPNAQFINNELTTCDPSVQSMECSPQLKSDNDLTVDLTDIDWSECVCSDPSYCKECHELLKRSELEKLLNYESATIYITKFENRTVRRNRNREQAYTIKPNQTLLELKKEIFTRCQVLPVDQRLFLDDVLLDDNTKTMSELKIVPDCSLKLEIDRPINDNIDLVEDESASRKACAQPETGFKGSLLLSNNHF